MFKLPGLTSSSYQLLSDCKVNNWGINDRRQLKPHLITKMSDITRRFGVILTSFSSDKCNGQFKFKIKAAPEEGTLDLKINGVTGIVNGQGKME